MTRVRLFAAATTLGGIGGWHGAHAGARLLDTPGFLAGWLVAATIGAVGAVALVLRGAPPRRRPYNTAQANGVSADQSRTLAHLKATHRDFGSGVLVSTGTSPNTHMTLRITYAVKDDNGAQNTQSSATFTWEARNTQ